MNTAIALTGNTRSSKLSKHFGRCSWFCLVNDATGEIGWMENPGLLVEGCKAGPIVSRLILNNVNRVISGDFGTNVQQLLNKHHIQMIIHPDETVKADTLIKLMMQQKK
ncbi:MAG TPA: NifB/NifX family molybdenum-iron cluster-binding protein [Bacteroidales bacterium]|nr:NifB/NifX family molybdenum-iron cluster-binding protein [Bacteroidales bacterium]